MPNTPMIKPIDDNLYDVVCGWWAAHGWPPIPMPMLGYGFVSFVAEKPGLFGCLYKAENCGYGMIEWIVSNPDTSYDERNEAFTELMEHLKILAKKIGVLAITTVSRNENLEKRLLSSGFSKTDEKLTLFFKPIN